MTAPVDPRHPRPPVFPRALLRALVPSRYRDNQLGDLQEEFRALARSKGLTSARRWYWRQALTSILGNVRLHLQERAASNRKDRIMMDSFRHDLKTAIRSLWKSKAYAVIAVLTLSLAVGVNAAIFSLVNIIASADIPISDPDGLGFVFMTNTRTGTEQLSISSQDLQDLRDHNRSFESLSALGGDNVILTGEGEPLRAIAYQITSNFFQTWGISPVIGRGFAPDEDHEGSPPVVMLSYGYWENRFAGDASALGRTIRVDGVEHTIIGVTPRALSFGNLAAAPIWLPLVLPATGGDREARDLLVSGRLLAGVSLARANEDLAAIGERLAEEYPVSNGMMGVQVLPTKKALLGDNLLQIMVLLSIAVGFILLIACANVGNMLLARASGRAREIAVRVALGAGRGRIVRQILLESVLLSSIAGAVGVAFAFLLMRGMVLITRGREVLFTMAVIDRNVVLFTVLVSLIAALGFGLIPALRATGIDINGILKEEGTRGGQGRRGSRLRGALVVTQVALALALMISAGIITRDVSKLSSQEKGYDETRLLSMVVDLPELGYEDDVDIARTFEQLLAGVSALPEVTTATIVNRRPGFSTNESGTSFEIEGRPAVDDEANLPRAVLTIGSTDYLEVMGIPLLRGRNFGAEDSHDAPPVVIVSETAVDRFWPGQDPVGQRIRLNDGTEWLRVVGIAGDSERGGGAFITPIPQFYVNFEQRPQRAMVLMARTLGDPGDLVSELRAAMWAVDANQPVDDVRSMAQYEYDNASGSYAFITLFMTFAVGGLIMSAMGVYGVMSYMVSQRKGEISLRIALGASRGDVLRMVLGQGVKLMVIGTGIGLLAAFGVSRIFKSLLVGVSATDPITYSLGLVILLVVALIANYVPAHRATKLSPMAAMRTE